MSLLAAAPTTTLLRVRSVLMPQACPPRTHVHHTQSRTGSDLTSVPGPTAHMHVPLTTTSNQLPPPTNALRIASCGNMVVSQHLLPRIHTLPSRVHLPMAPAPRD